MSIVYAIIVVVLLCRENRETPLLYRVAGTVYGGARAKQWAVRDGRPFWYVHVGCVLANFVDATIHRNFCLKKRLLNFEWFICCMRMAPVDAVHLFVYFVAANLHGIYAVLVGAHRRAIEIFFCRYALGARWSTVSTYRQHKRHRRCHRINIQCP